MILSLDLETYSDIDLRNCGVYRYVEGDFHILLCAYAFDDDDVKIIDTAQGEELPKEVRDAIFDESVIKCAWNAQFERVCLSHYFRRPIPPESWHCTMVQAATLSFPLSLETAAQVLGVEDQKDKTGERLIRYFSVPCKPTKSNGQRTRNLPEHAPEDWEKFKAYCVQDVRTERAIRYRLDDYPFQADWDLYHLDQRINDRGIRVDLVLVKKAIECNTEISEKIMKRACEVTGIENPNSVKQLKEWFEGKDLKIPSLSKKDVAEMLKNTENPEALEMLKLRQLISKSSVKKYQAAERCTCADGRARGLFQYYGANRTGRWSGRNIQLQNLPQNHIATLDDARRLLKNGNFDALEIVYDNVPEILSQLIRTMLIPREGFEFVVVDFSAIEARVLAWLANEEWVLNAFRNNEDIYCSVASQMFGVPVVKHGENGELRQKGKVAVLACGYSGGVGALKAMGASEMGLDENELSEIISSWRKSNPNIVKFWRDTEYNALKAIDDPFQEFQVNRTAFLGTEGTLWARLPSGRRLAYMQPQRTQSRFGFDTITYKGVNSANKWTDIESYGGKITENLTQATARDLLAEAMLRMEKYGLEIAAHVHDEILLEVPKNSITVEKVCEIMNTLPDWADGLPINSAGYKCNYYFKD